VGAETGGRDRGQRPEAETRGRDQGQRLSALWIGVAVHRSRETRTTEIRAINIRLTYNLSKGLNSFSPDQFTPKNEAQFSINQRPDNA
jgi:hypothetical protein